MTVVLTFDLGTTFFKAALFDEQEQLLALARCPTPTNTPHPGWAEVDPTAFREAIVHLVTHLREQDRPALNRVRQVCFATQTNSFVLLDDADQPITPIVLWSDRRVDRLPSEVERMTHDLDFYMRTGVPSLSPLFMGAKLAWLRQHDASLWRRAKRLCLIGDYLTLWLTGEHVTEAGAAGLTGLIDIHALTWRPNAVAVLGLNNITLPRIDRAGARVGRIRPEVSAALGLAHDSELTLGCLDQYAGAVGVGVTEPGVVCETTGTVLATVCLASHFDERLGRRGVFQGPAFREGWYFRMVFSSVSAGLLETLRTRHAPETSYRELDAEAADVPAGAEGLSLDLEASEKAGEPVFRNAASHHRRGHRVRAILEGVATALKQQVSAVSGESTPSEILCAGGGSRSVLWLRIKAEALGVPTVAPDCPEPTCRGAARLAHLRSHKETGDRAWPLQHP